VSLSLRRALPLGWILATFFLLMRPRPAWAHGIGGRVDLPVPRWLFVYGAATAVIVSFVALGVLWREARLEGSGSGRRLPSWVQAVATNALVEWTLRLVSLALFLLVAVSAATAGTTGVSVAPVVVYVWVWVGMAFAHALGGNLWATLSPWDTLARLFAVGEEPARRYPPALGLWPAVAGLAGFVWLELVYPQGATPSTLAAVIVVYTAVTLVGMALFGRATWNRHGEFLAVYLGLLARIAPLGRDSSGAVVVRSPLQGLPSTPPQPGLVPFVAVLLGSTSFDGFSRSTFWLDRTGSLSGAERILAGTAGLIGAVVLVLALYSLAMAAASWIGGSHWHPLSVRFVHSLVPIAFAYVAAHYFSLLVLEGQAGVALLSDPFGAGWNLFGTATWGVNLALVSATTIWYVQVAAIVTGHVAGVILAHDRAIALFPPGRALGTQYALLGVMVMLTVGGLVILSGG
jgi:hypothetical protein